MRKTTHMNSNSKEKAITANTGQKKTTTALLGISKTWNIEVHRKSRQSQHAKPLYTDGAGAALYSRFHYNALEFTPGGVHPVACVNKQEIMNKINREMCFNCNALEFTPCGVHPVACVQKQENIERTNVNEQCV